MRFEDLDAVGARRGARARDHVVLGGGRRGGQAADQRGSSEYAHAGNDSSLDAALGTLEGVTLVIMAAGLASRYGSSKQLDGVGPRGELLLEYSIFDARRAGFTRVVFIIRREIEPAMREFARRLPADLTVDFAVQDLSQVPSWFATPSTRTKPWGTVHAVLAARGILDGPFAVLNADDFYGPDAFLRARAACDEANAAGVASAILFPVSATLSSHGSVIRGICNVDDGYLVELDEVRDIKREGNALRGHVNHVVRTLTGAELASMNFWVFPHAALALLADEFESFLKAYGDEETSESILPEAVSDLMAAGKLRVRALSAPGPWFGLTHQADRENVRAGLKQLTADGVYPSPLWK
ncbi:MAG: nucleotidyltransferase [Acidobacteria bacterium]|nr:MAG: nucleotidyltransferase [Acidobacteriota bacterium]